MQTASSSLDVKGKIFQTIDGLKASNADFEHAFETYVQQYGKDKVGFGKPVNLAGTVDPVAIVVGRNCIAHYLDSTKTVRGSKGSLNLNLGDVCIIGRKEPQDGALMAWKANGDEVKLEEYNSNASIIPSRIHCAVAYVEEGQVLFADLGSSSGTTVVGDRLRNGAFVTVYDPGMTSSPAVKFERVFTSKSS